MGTRWSMLTRLGSFALTTGLTTIVGLVAVPVIIAGTGPHLWGVQAAIQTASGLFGVFVSFGWGTTGAAHIASAIPAARPQEYVESLVSRAYLALIVYPLMVIVMGIINPAHLDIVLIGSATFLMPSLGASWYFVGEARPSRLFWFDGFPQTLGIAVSVPVMLATHSLALVLATQLIFNFAAVVVSAVTIVRTAEHPPTVVLSPRKSFARLGEQRHAVMTAGTAAMYVSLPLLIVNAFAPASVALYAMGDKLFRFALTAFLPVLQVIQGWLPEGGREDLPRRIGLTARFTPAIGILGGAFIVALGPFAARLLSSRQIDLGLSLAVPFGIVFAAVAITQVLGLACLVQLNETRSLARSTLIGALLGTVFIVVGVFVAGPQGVAWALALSEVAVLIYQYRVVTNRLRALHPAIK